MKRNYKKNKGITLIALVVTIVVSLILAGVSMAALSGENGIISSAFNAKENTRGAQAKEQVEMAVLENDKRKIKKQTLKTREEVIDKLHEDGLLKDDEVEELESKNIIKIGNIEIDFSELGKVIVYYPYLRENHRLALKDEEGNDVSFEDSWVTKIRDIDVDYNVQGCYVAGDKNVLLWNYFSPLLGTGAVLPEDGDVINFTIQKDSKLYYGSDTFYWPLI